MAESPKEHHNGHHEVPAGSGRTRSGFDRRRNWGDSIENVYRRIDHRLGELMQQGREEGEHWVREAETRVRRAPASALGGAFLFGLLAGILVARSLEND